MSPPRLRQLPEVGGLSYESMLTSIRLVPDLLSNLQAHLDKRVDRLTADAESRAARMEAKIDLIHIECARKEDVKKLDNDLGENFEKLREIESSVDRIKNVTGIHDDADDEFKVKLDKVEERLRKVENSASYERGRFSIGEKIMGAILGLVMLAAAAYLGLK